MVMAKSPLLPQIIDGHLIVSIHPEKLAAARREAGLTQTELAAAIGMSSCHLSLVERGRRKAARDMVTGIAKVLDVPLVDICVHAPAPGGEAA